MNNDMNSILRNFAAAKDGNVIDAEGNATPSNAAQEKNAMKSLLEGLDAAQTSVNQMPAQHKMAKNTATKHPASKFLVGGRYEDEGPDFYDGQQVQLVPPYEETPGEVFTLSQWDGRKGWIGDAQGRGWGVNADQIKPADEEDDIEDDYYEGAEPEWFNEPQIKPGVSVHIGHHTKGGAGVEGRVVKVTDENVYIKNDDGQTYKGQLKNTTVNEAGITEAKAESNFTQEDLANLSTIKDLGTLKNRAIQLISNPDSARPMKPEKVAWFTRAIEQKTNVPAIIKMMWDLFLSGEGSGVIGTKGSMQKSAYRGRFGEDTNEDTIAKRKTGSDVHKKQSFKDIFRSMDETEDDMATRFKKELHDEKTTAALTTGDNGKFNLAEAEMGKTIASFDSMARDMVRLMNKGKTVTVEADRVQGIGRMEGMVVEYKLDWKDKMTEAAEESGWGDELIEALKLLLQDAQRPADVVAGVQDLIQQYEAPLSEGDIISGDYDSDIDRFAEQLGQALFIEAVTLAKEVYAEEGAGQSGARTEEKYVRDAVRRFMTPEYMRAIMGNILEAYKTEVQDKT